MSIEALNAASDSRTIDSPFLEFVVKQTAIFNKASLMVRTPFFQSGFVDVPKILITTELK